MIEANRDEGAPSAAPSGNPEGNDKSSLPSGKVGVRSDGLIVWAVLSIGFLAYIAFGSVDARIWRFRSIQIEPRSVLRVWTLQAETLPRVSQQWLLTTLFYSCMILIIACTVIGIWLLLDSAGTGFSKSGSNANPDQDVV